MPLYGPCSWNILVHRCFEASDSGSRNRDFIVLFTQKTWLCSKSESEVTGAFGDTHKVKTGVRLGKMSFRLVVVPKRACETVGLSARRLKPADSQAIDRETNPAVT